METGSNQLSHRPSFFNIALIQMLMFKAWHCSQTVLASLSNLWRTPIITSGRQTSLCVVVVFSGIFQTKQKHSQLHLNYKVVCCVPFVILCPPKASLCPRFWHLCPTECNSQPSSQWTRKAASLPACQLSPLRPTDCGGMGWPLEANGSCPPPRAENELECCLPQTHQATAQKDRLQYRSSSLRLR